MTKENLERAVIEQELDVIPLCPKCGVCLTKIDVSLSITKGMEYMRSASGSMRFFTKNSTQNEFNVKCVKCGANVTEATEIIPREVLNWEL